VSSTVAAFADSRLKIQQQGELTYECAALSSSSSSSPLYCGSALQLLLLVSTGRLPVAAADYTRLAGQLSLHFYDISPQIADELTSNSAQTHARTLLRRPCATVCA
jgi:hypothetical protein